MDEELELSDEVRELFLAGKLDALLEHVARVGAEAAKDEKRRKYNEWQRRHLKENPQVAERKRDSKRRTHHKRYAEDSKYREELLERSRDYKRERREDPEYRRSELDRLNEQRRERYATDPEYRQKMLDLARERQGTPEYREHINSRRREEGYWRSEEYKAKRREYYARKKAQKEAQGNND